MIELYKSYADSIKSSISYKKKDYCPEYYFVALSVETLHKAFHTIFFDNLKEVENFEQELSKYIRGHSTYMFQLKEFRKCSQEELFRRFPDDAKELNELRNMDNNSAMNYFKNLSYSSFKDNDFYSEIKELMNMLLNDFNKYGNIINSISLEKINFLLSKTNQKFSEVNGKKQALGIINIMFVKAGLNILSIIFNPLHNELRYFDEIDKKEFTDSELYKDLAFFLEFLNEICNSFEFFIKIHKIITLEEKNQ